MKIFQFRLARVLHIRMTQERTEQQKLDQLQTAYRRIEAEIEALQQSVTRAQQTLLGSPSLSAAELIQWKAYERGSQVVHQELTKKLEAQAKLVSAQSEIVVVARRNVKLLEKLQEKQRADWSEAAERELEALAEDFAAAQWSRSGR